MSTREVSNYNYEIKTFKELSRADQDRVASVVETRSGETVLSPIVEDFVYASSRALDYGDYFGTLDKSALWEHTVNKNHDYFDVTVLNEEHPVRKIPRYMTFRTANMYVDHNSKNIENSIGFVFDVYDVRSAYDDMHLVLLFGIDKKKAPRIARDLETHPTRVPTSMGCSITGVKCTVCGESMCDHIKYMKGGRVGGKRVAEMLQGVEFFEDSIVSVPACHTAYVLDAVSSIVPGRLLKIAAESDDSMITMHIMASIYDSIKTAKTYQEKVKLSSQLDYFISKLEALSTVTI